MMNVEFTHHGDACTFETLLKRFAITDSAARRIGEMIHDADLEDGEFQRPECSGLDLVFKGWARLSLSDAEILDMFRRAPRLIAQGRLLNGDSRKLTLHEADLEG